MSKVRFGDVASRLNIKVDQANTDLEYYIGGEHIESSEFMIHNRAPIKGSTIGYQFQFGFRKGDILFMTKNPHLRKASMVDFDGLCSIATFVIHTNDESILLQDYLLIEMQTDRFWDYCETHKSGGVNYFINWGTLANYELELPPIEEQRQLSEKLWAAYRLKESYRQLLKATDEMVKSRFIEEFNNPEIPKVSMSELCTTFIDGDWIEAKDQSDSGYRLVQTGNVGVCEYVEKEEHARFVSEDTFKRLNCTEIHPGDILFSRLPDPIGRCCMIPQGFQKAITAVDCTITRLKDNCLPEYLMVYTTTNMYSEQIKTCITGTTRQRISRGNLAKIQVPLPTTDCQQSFVNLVHQADKSKFEVKQAIEKIDTVMRSLLQ